MPTDSAWLQAVITIGFGALAGGITNALAIWMLFHPYTARGLGRFKIHGAIPKNRARLAKTIGRTVGQRLITSEDLGRQLSAPEIRAAFDQAVGKFVAEIIEPERGSLRQELPQGLYAEIACALEAVAPAIADRFIEFASTDEFTAAVGRGLERAAEEWADRPVGEVLTTERRAAMRERVEQWVANAVSSEDLDRTIGGWIDRQLETLAADRNPLLDRLPAGLVGVVERAIANYLPVALERLAAVLADPDARLRIERALHKLFERFVQDLLIHQRIVARLVVTERTIARLLENFEKEGVDELARLLDEPEMRAHVARSVNDAVVKFLRKPLADHLQALGAERVRGLRSTATGYVAAALRDEATRGYAIERLDHALLGNEQRTWGDLWRHLPRERAASWIAQALASPAPRQWIAEGTQSAITYLMDRPIGSPSAWLPEDSSRRITEALAPVLWEWIQRQVPVVVEQVDVATMVEQKVLAFSLARVEELVRSTTQRELDLIVKLGYLLGAIVGSAAFATTRLLA